MWDVECGGIPYIDYKYSEGTEEVIQLYSRTRDSEASRFVWAQT